MHLRLTRALEDSLECGSDHDEITYPANADHEYFFWSLCGHFSLRISSSMSHSKVIMHLIVKTSPGEFLDKLTILEIKAERIRDPRKLENVERELAHLRLVWTESSLSKLDVSGLVSELKSINESLWEIEDKIRLKEGAKQFDDEFIQLARSVYLTNDRRAAVKRELNITLGSELLEEKSYANKPSS